MSSPPLLSVGGMGRVPSFINHAGVVLGSPVEKDGEEERSESPRDLAAAPAVVSEVGAPTVEGDAGCRLSISALVFKEANRR